MGHKRVWVGIWLVVFWGVFLWSAVGAADRFTWFLEVFPAGIAFFVLAGTYRRFELTSLVYWLILGQAIILMVGGHYTYSQVPLFNWIRDAFGQSRNNFDKLGHFAQGFVPAMAAREVLLRTSPLKRGKWLFFIVACVALAISAFYELFEWQVAVWTGEAAESFLGMQGYAWDTQSDMAWALFGAVVALILLGSYHDRLLGERGSFEL